MLANDLSPWPCFSTEEADAVSRVLLSNKVNYWSGRQCREFEAEFADFAGTRHAIALANGTVALELALRALGVGPEDEVVVTPRSFIASASSVVTVGGTPVFADVDEDSQNLTAETIRAVITPRTKAIICVHLAGWPCEMDEIMALADKHGLFVIEDCAQAHGATYRGRSVGSIGHVGAWSFCQDKIITTGGEGGMVTTNDADLWSRMWAYKDHGKSWEAVSQREHAPGFRWLHESFGTNWRMTEMQAAIGRIQLEKLPEWHRKRRQNAARLGDACNEIGALRVPSPPAHLEHAYYRFYAFLRPDLPSAAKGRDEIVNAICRQGVPCIHGSCSEVYREKAFTRFGLGPEHRLPVAQQLGETSLAFLVHPTLKDSEIDQMCRGIRDAFAC